MSRFPKRRVGPMFRTSDLLRLMAMVGMFCVLAMMMFRARDASMWRWLTSESQPSYGAPEDLARQQAAAQKRDLPLAEPPPNHPEQAAEQQKPATKAVEQPAKATDQDPEQWRQAEFEFQLIEDMTKLDGLEMQAYWRLVNWVRSQTSADLAQRSRNDVLFTHLREHPSQYRGRPIRLKLHLMRSLRYEAGTNRYGIKWLYEVWGWTNDSQPYPYCIVFTDWPRGMPLGTDIQEEATVDGYFLKLMKYEAHDGKQRVAPLIIGRLVWHPNPSRLHNPTAESFWTTVLIGAAILVLVLGVWVFRLVFRSSKLIAPTSLSTAKTEQWLNRVEQGEETIRLDEAPGNDFATFDEDMEAASEPIRGEQRS